MTWWRWILNISNHTNHKADSSLVLSFHTISIFLPLPFSHSSCAPSVCLHPLTSPSAPGSEVSFSSAGTPFSLSFLPFCFPPLPCTCKGWCQMRAHFYTQNIWMKVIKSPWCAAPLYTDRRTAWTSSHTLYFSIEAMDCLKAPDENPLNRTFFTFTCIRRVTPAGAMGAVTPVYFHRNQCIANNAWVKYFYSVFLVFLLEPFSEPVINFLTLLLMVFAANKYRCCFKCAAAHTL